MSSSPTLLFHIVTGTLGMVSGFMAVSLRKGSRQHALAGKLFVVSMLCLAASGVYLSVVQSHLGSAPGGALTFYMVATAWMTARRGDRETGIFDWGALLLCLVVVTLTATWGLAAATSPTGTKYGYSPGPYVFLGIVGLLAAIGDVRMLVRGGISGTPRIARHLWRMCFALFIAAGSIFLARQHVFPALLRKTGVLVFLSFLPLLLMVFWLLRVRFTNSYRTVIDHRRPVPAR